MKDFPSLKDHFLIAMPTMADPRFSQTVTYILEHDDQGAMGVVINKPMEVNLDELFDHLEIETAEDFIVSKAGQKKIMSGGPVQIERGFILHKPFGEWDSSMQLNEDICVTTSKDILTAISKAESPEEVEIALGYAGWEEGQLDQEILENTWLSVPADPAILFHTPADLRWEAAAKLIGIDINNLALRAGHS